MNSFTGQPIFKYVDNHATWICVGTENGKETIYSAKCPINTTKQEAMKHIKRNFQEVKDIFNEKR